MARRLKILNQRCEILFPVNAKDKEKEMPERLLLEEGPGEEAYKILSVNKETDTYMIRKKPFILYWIKVCLRYSGDIWMLVGHNHELDQSYLLLDY